MEFYVEFRGNGSKKRLSNEDKKGIMNSDWGIKSKKAKNICFWVILDHLVILYLYLSFFWVKKSKINILFQEAW